MCEPATIAMISMAASVAGTGISAISAMNQASANKQIAQNNATVADYQAQDIQRRGEEDAQAVQRRAAAIKSAQRVNLASKGLDLGYGTAADLQDQTDFFAASDAATARTNAAKDAWGKRAMGANYRAEASAQNPMLAGAGTLLGGGAQVADKWYRYKNGG
jgi:hypothetical protein